MLANTRDLDGQTQKKSSRFCTLEAEPQHICVGLPHGAKVSWLAFRMYGVSTKYLGNHFDIHGGGMKFPS
jgi:cysteinyl-tRNA synthetase